MPRRTSVYVDDVGGHFERLVKGGGANAFRLALRGAIAETADHVEGRMKSYARVGPDAPHIKDDIETRVSPRSAQIGYLMPKSAGGTDPQATQPDVALFQNYGTKKAKGNAFMERAADDSANGFRAAAIKALGEAARTLAI